MPFVIRDITKCKGKATNNFVYGAVSKIVVSRTSSSSGCIMNLIGASCIIGAFTQATSSEDVIAVSFQFQIQKIFQFVIFVRP